MPLIVRNSDFSGQLKQHGKYGGFNMAIYDPNIEPYVPMSILDMALLSIDASSYQVQASLWQPLALRNLHHSKRFNENSERLCPVKPLSLLFVHCHCRIQAYDACMVPRTQLQEQRPDQDFEILPENWAAAKGLWFSSLTTLQQDDIPSSRVAASQSQPPQLEALHAPCLQNPPSAIKWSLHASTTKPVVESSVMIAAWGPIPRPEPYEPLNALNPAPPHWP